MGILAWIIFGLIAGALAKFIFPGNNRVGWILTIILGIVGAVVGGWIGSALGWGTVTAFDFRSLVLAVLGAIVVLAVASLFRK